MTFENVEFVILILFYIAHYLNLEIFIMLRLQTEKSVLKIYGL